MTIFLENFAIIVTESQVGISLLEVIILIIEIIENLLRIEEDFRFLNIL